MRRLAYPVFGLGVVLAYLAYSLGGTTPSSTAVRRSSVGLYDDYSIAPIIWSTPFHGPAPEPPREPSGGYVGGGSYGGWFGGK